MEERGRGGRWRREVGKGGGGREVGELGKWRERGMGRGERKGKNVGGREELRGKERGREGGGRKS